MATTQASARTGKHREQGRRAGPRPGQTGAPDTSQPDLTAKCRRQSQLAAEADRGDPDPMRFLDDVDDVLADLDAPALDAPDLDAA